MVHSLNVNKWFSGLFWLYVELLEEISADDLTENNDILTLYEMLMR